MKIADNVEVLEIEGEHGVLYPVLIYDNANLVLVDTALPGQIEMLEKAVSNAGFSLEDITHVIITHQDMDHIGCAKILAGFGAEIMAHENEAPYIQGEKTLIKISEMEDRFAELNEGERAFYERLKKGAPHFHVHVDRLLKDGEMLDYCGGIQVVHTPGHTPGHIALLLKHDNIMIAGDAANILDNCLTGANPQYTSNQAEAQKSFERILTYYPDSVVCYHGGWLPLCVI